MDIYREAGVFFEMYKEKPAPVVMFGAGERGKIWSNFLQNMGVKFFAACDNQKTGVLKNHYLENQYPQEYFPEEIIRIIRPEDLDKETEYFIVLSSDSEGAQRAIIDQLNSLNVRGSVFLGKSYQNVCGKRELILSFAPNHEDVILYHALRNVERVFYLDIGAYDPWMHSLTQLFYLNGGTGVNIEANVTYYEKLAAERPRDVNLNIAVSDKTGESEFPLDYGGWGTLNREFTEFVESFVKIEKPRYAKVPLDTLGNIIARHVPEGQPVHFCKIDVEGYEEKCLAGMNWDGARPWIFCVESVLESRDATRRMDLKWEHILVEHGYVPALTDLNNKYYVANEHRELAGGLLPRWYLFQLYACYQARPSHALRKPEDAYYWSPEEEYPGCVGVQRG